MKKPIVVGLGEVLWDMLPDGKRAGGAPANVAYHAAHSGAEGWLVSAVGADSLGRELAEVLAQHGVQSVLPQVPYPTGQVNVRLCQGIPSYEIAADVAWDHIPLRPQARQLLSGADAVCFGSLAFRSEESRRTLSTLLKSMPDGALKVLDINLRAPYYSAQLLSELLKMCNALKLNDEEVKILSVLFDIGGTAEEVCRELLARYRLKFLILTAGSSYSEVYTPGAVSHINTPSVQVVDTVGAGDSFTASFVSATLQGCSLTQAHERAVQTAARVCGHKGAWG